MCNTGTTGQLPVLWGVNASFPSLQSLDVSRNLISGEGSHYAQPKLAWGIITQGLPTACKLQSPLHRAVLPAACRCKPPDIMFAGARVSACFLGGAGRLPNPGGPQHQRQ